MVVDQASITIPAYFNNQQRTEAISGPDMFHIIKEPTAATTTYGIGNNTAEDMNVLILDLRG